MSDAESRDPQSFVRALARGLAVIEVMGGEVKGLGLSEVAARCNLDRATARRLLLTLIELGFVRAEGNRFHLTPRVLALGYAYLSSFPFWEVARPLMARLVEHVHESCSAATLDGPYAVYVARIRRNERIVDVSRTVGSRIPAYCTSLGRVLLAGCLEDERKRLLKASPLAAGTSFTVTDTKTLLEILRGVAEQGHAIVDQELELGLRSIAVPVYDERHAVIAALNISVQGGEASVDDMRERYLPALRRTAEEISRAFIARGVR